MKRFLSILLALALALTLGIPALAAEHRAGDTYIRILGSSGARTVASAPPTERTGRRQTARCTGTTGMSLSTPTTG